MEQANKECLKTNKKPGIVVINGMVLLLFLGLIYAWSIFVIPLETEFGWSRSQTSLTFSICMSFFCLGGLVAGFLARRLSGRVTLGLCAVFILVGFAGASRIHSLGGLYLTYGVLVGFGVGLGYNTILSTVLPWFPKRQGLISGLLLMSFGFGGMVLGTLSTRLNETIGWRNTFLSLGIGFCILLLLGTIFLVSRPQEQQVAQQEDRSYTTGQMVKRPSFYQFMIWSIVLTGAGLILLGHATPIATGIGLSLAKATIMAGLISMSNGIGRVIIGYFFDRLGHRKVLKLVSTGFILSALLLFFALQWESASLLTVSYVLTGLSYGGVPSMNSALTSKFYGVRHYSSNFGVVNLNIIPASFGGPYLAGILQTASGSYQTTVLLMLGFGVVALIDSFFIRHP